MALAQYSDTFWFPSGVLASATPARVFLENGNTFATLWADSAGTIALPNPLNTDAVGVLTFWAESGNYWVHLDSEAFLVEVGMSQEEADLSTGIASGGRLTVNGANPAAVDISPVDGYIVDYLAGTQAKPVITRVKTQAQTVPLDAAALLRTVTWWLLDSTGAVIQQATRPSRVQHRTHIVLGLTAFDGASIFVENEIDVLLQQPVNQLYDLMDSLQPFSISGNLITPNGVNLMINNSSGEVFARGFNWFSAGVPNNDPHVVQTIAESPTQFSRFHQATTNFLPTFTTLDVANYDNGGVVTPVGGGTNRATVQRVWIVATGIAGNQIAVQYGQNVYSSLSAAVDSIGHGGFVTNPSFPGNSALLAYIAVIRTATNLSDPAQAVIITAGKFATP